MCTLALKNKQLVTTWAVNGVQWVRQVKILKKQEAGDDLGVCVLNLQIV